MALLVLSGLLPILAFVFVPILGFPENVNSVVYALSLAGGPDVLMVAAAAVMGKQNVEEVLGKVGGWIRRLFRWDSVSRRRYTIGVWVLTVSFFVPTVIALFFDDSVVGLDNQPGWGYYVMIASSVAFIAAFLSMGAPLWRRVRAVYTWDAQIIFPDVASEVDLDR